jgi:hypothetical protein
VKALIALAACFLSGCAALYPQAEQPLEVDAVMGEVLAASRAPGGDQKAALARAQQGFVEAQTPLNRLRLAALLAVLPAPLRDDARAAELLEPIADGTHAGVSRFAAFLAAEVAERQRLARELERASRESERLVKDRERAERERERSDKERDKREEALRQQLEALRSIERGILEREDRLRRRR